MKVTAAQTLKGFLFRSAAFLILFAFSQTGASEKLYKPDSKIFSKAYFSIDGKLSKPSVPVYGTTKRSVLFIYKKIAECKYEYLGLIKATNKKSTDPIPVQAGIGYFLIFKRVEKDFPFGPGGIILGNTDRVTDSEIVFLTPKKNFTYVFQYREEKKFIDFNVIQIDSQKKHTELDVYQLKKHSCKEIEGLDAKK